ncbi:hypothetical protein DS884_08260 [Tenacibaculum sp. E3R01]|uniref:hypothetical protein n=1 Tax=Tenacibaculum sp. E3R01 TaxID=2267227 RepID=UPI000DEA15BC|nr:hypothetical protein [Tenacibaculum sp. E3R01]RBW59719.1 hypothetical protein DS884_08260 [Tenacibaculum sp. E3R01]
MKKLSYKSSWLFLLIPLGIVFFVLVPEFEGKYKKYAEKQLTLQKDIYKLDSLRQLQHPTSKDKHLLKKLEITVPIHTKVYGKEKFLYFKTGGMLLVLAFMGIGMVTTSYISNRNKTSSKNKQVNFTFDDYTNDVIGEQISWEAVESSGSNFASETFKKTPKGYKITSSSFTKIFAWSFLLIGLNYVVFSFYEYYQFNTSPLTFMKGGKLFFISGGPFLLIGCFLALLFSPKVHIHTRKRKIIVGGEILSFQQVYALQVLQKFTEGSSSSGSYFSYELNLVTNKGDRFNLLNHGDKQYLLSDMIKISKLLNVPVWNAGVV